MYCANLFSFYEYNIYRLGPWNFVFVPGCSRLVLLHLLTESYSDFIVDLLRVRTRVPILLRIFAALMHEDNLKPISFTKIVTFKFREVTDTLSNRILIKLDGPI